MQNVTKYPAIYIFYFVIIIFLSSIMPGCNKDTRIPRSEPNSVNKKETTQISTETHSKLKIMSFNIRYGTADDGPNVWPVRKNLVFDIFKNHQPDIVGLQESLRFQLDEIQENLPGQYTEIGVGRDDGKQTGEYSPILYRTDRFDMIDSGTFWFSDTPEIPGSKSWGNNIPRICTWAILEIKPDSTMQTQQIYVYNVHLDHQSQASRERSTQFLAQKVAAIKADNPIIIVTGDFNAGEDNPAITSLIASMGLLDAYRIIHFAAENTGTFNSFSGNTNGPKIDYIFLSDLNNKLKVLDAQILHDNNNNRYPSDHFPVTADIQINL